MMKHHDEMVERVLAAVRTAEPPAGMERRILARLEAQPSASASRRFYPTEWISWRPMMKISSVGALVLASLLVMIAVMHRPEKTLVRDAKSSQVMVDHSDVVSIASAPLRVTPAHTKTTSAVRSAVAHKSHATTSADAPAEAASFPAPPMPLTEQEQLLLRMAHGRDQQAVAILRPEIQSKQEAVEIAQFEEFFKEQKIEVKHAPAD